MPGQTDVLNVVLLVSALALSAFFSSSETAIMSLQRIRLRHLERIGVRGVARVRRLVDQQDRTLVTILIGNNLVNTAAAALGTVIANQFLGAEAAVIVATVSITVLLLVFGEITPKTVAIWHSERLATLYALPLEILSRLFAPLTALFSRLGTLVAALAGGDATRSVFSQEEIQTVILMGEETGILRREDSEILRNVLELPYTIVRDVMVPRPDVVGVRATQTLTETAQMVAASGYTRFPVYEESIDNILGIVHAKDVLLRQLAHDSNVSVRALMRPALFTPETKTVSSLLREMRVQNTQMAIVIDEYGGTAGIVTLEDLLEEVVGEITSEHGAERRFVRSLTARQVIVDAAIPLEDLNDVFGIDLPTEEANTLGGFIFQHLGRVPAVRDRFQYGNLSFTILSMRGPRIVLVRIDKGANAP